MSATKHTILNAANAIETNWSYLLYSARRADGKKLLDAGKITVAEFKTQYPAISVLEFDSVVPEDKKQIFKNLIAAINDILKADQIALPNYSIIRAEKHFVPQLIANFVVNFANQFPDPNWYIDEASVIVIQLLTFEDPMKDLVQTCTLVASAAFDTAVAKPTYAQILKSNK